MAGRDDNEGRGARKAVAGLNRDLDAIAAAKRPRVLLPALLWTLGAIVVLPVAWVLLYGIIEAPGTILMAQRALSGETIRRTPVKLEAISSDLVRAVIAAEDSGFCGHDGFEIEAIQAALDSNKKGGKIRGGSTVSQQTAKNLFLWPDRSYVRKGMEAYFTVLIEAFWSKRRIMEAYLNAAEWGDGVFGAEAAAQARFGVSAKDLTPIQAARLAAVLPSPNKWSANKPGPYVRKRARAILGRANAVRAGNLDTCVLTGAEARAHPIAPPRRRDAPPTPPPILPPLEPVPDALLSTIETSLVPEEEKSGLEGTGRDASPESVAAPAGQAGPLAAVPDLTAPGPAPEQPVPR